MKLINNTAGAIVFGLSLAFSGAALAHGGHGGGHHGGGHHSSHHSSHHGYKNGYHNKGWNNKGWNNKGWNNGWRNGYYNNTVVGVPAGNYYNPVCTKVKKCNLSGCYIKKICN